MMKLQCHNKDKVVNEEQNKDLQCQNKDKVMNLSRIRSYSELEE